MTTLPASTPLLNAEPIAEHRSPEVEALRRLLKHRSAQAGLLMIAFIVLVAIFADFIAPYPYTFIFKEGKRFEAPCVHLLGCDPAKTEHLFGLDGNGRDLFSRVVYGSRLSIMIGLVTNIGAILVGALIGAIAGYAGGWWDTILMRSMDVLMAFPSLLLAIAIVTALGPGLINALLAIAVVSIPVYARLVRASVLSVKDLEFVQASRALGASPMRLLFTRILPNAVTPVLVQGTLGIATAILDAAALSFLGLGAEKPTPEWGLMLGEERARALSNPHLLIFPGLAIMMTVLSFNLLGDGLRDALDPRLKR